MIRHIFNTLSLISALLCLGPTEPDELSAEFVNGHAKDSPRVNITTKVRQSIHHQRRAMLRGV